MTKTFDARQDLIGRLGPPERLRAFIRDVDEATDGRLQFPGAAVDAPPKLFLGEGGEPALHEVHPGAAGRREVDMDPGMPHQPAVNQRGLMRAGVVDNKVEVQRRRDRSRRRESKLPAPALPPYLECSCCSSFRPGSAFNEQWCGAWNSL